MYRTHNKNTSLISNCSSIVFNEKNRTSDIVLIE